MEQETPIQELAAYYVVPGAEPAQEQSFSYTIRTSADPAEFPTVDELTSFIDGRHVADERSTVVALPNGAPHGKPRQEAGRRENPRVRSGEPDFD